MKREDIVALLEKYHAGLTSEEENALLESWYLSRGKALPLYGGRIDYDVRKQEIWQAIAENRSQPERRVRTLWPRIAAAASIIFVLSMGGYFYFKPVQPLKNDVPPGSNTATLTLSNGKKIVLSAANNGQLAREAGVSITKRADGQLFYTIADKAAAANGFNTLSTAKGETYKVNLPDGTQVWLNAASSLTYPARFAGKERKVSLTGEGYFEVAKDKLHPFKVNTGSQEVTVLGTHFNINSYSDEPATKTTLLEGSVKITANHKERMLQPGQQVTFSNGQFKLDEVDTELAAAWKNNKFLFDGDRIDYIMRMVKRWYNVEVVYQGNISTEKFYGGTSRYANVSEVLKSLEATGKIHFRIEDHKIIVTQ